MNTQKIVVTAEQVDNLIEDLRRLPDSIEDGHLSDDDAIQYSMNTLPLEEVQRVDKHIASCERCLADMKGFLAESSAWNGAQGEARLEQFAERVRAAMQLPVKPSLSDVVRQLAQRVTAFFDQSNFRLGLGNAAVVVGKNAITWRDGQTDDGWIRWRFAPDAEENVRISFGSHHLELEGLQLRLEAGTWAHDLVLEKEDPEDDQVGADVILTVAERQQIPANAPLKVTFVDLLTGTENTIRISE